LDTNILVRYAATEDSQFAVVDAVLNELRDSGEVLCVVPQNIYEFWATATRPTGSANGLGLSVAECEAHVARIQRLFRLLPDTPNLFVEWEAIVRDYACYGRVSYDARLVAAMRTHGVSRILTFNASDFTRFPDLAVVVPRL
jgi:predicted nucleic acid-binding protein